MHTCANNRMSEPAGSERRHGRRIRGLLGGATAAVLVAGGAATVPPSAAAAEEKQSYIVVLKDSVADVDITAAEHKKKYALTQSHIYKHALKGYAASMTASEAKRFGADASVDFVAPAKTFQLTPGPRPESAQIVPVWWQRVTAEGKKDDKKEDKGKEYRRINVNTAVIDTGIDSTHPDLNVRGGVDCTSGTAVPETPVDLHGHGTGVAGIIGAKDNNTGIIGTAPGAPLWSARVSGTEEEFPDANMVCAIDWVTSTRTDKDRGNDIEVANMSVGTFGADTANCGKGVDPLHLAICRSVKAGVTYVVAAGNEGADYATLVPAAYDEVITASAMADFDGRPGAKAQPDCFGDRSPDFGLDDQAAPFSNFAASREDRKHTAAAPGVCMLTTAPGNELLVWDGTSLASPVVAGTLALCIADRTCNGSPKDKMTKFLEKTRECNVKNPRFGFLGDPLRPIGNRYYGYLVNRSIFEPKSGYGPRTAGY